MKKNHLFSIITAGMLTITLLAGCGNTGSNAMSSKNKVSEIEVPVVELPTRLIDIGFKPKSNNTVEMILDNGWQLSFRIHSASTKVEPSLKFDVQFISMPVSVCTIKCVWK